jgi:transcriptional regulator with XRE-family HTH domain
MVQSETSVDYVRGSWADVFRGLWWGMSVHTAAQPIGNLLRDWRQRRRFSQLDLACEAEISQRHLSFIESGRSTPSREMILHLAEQLDVPLRERNAMLLAAGYAPTFAERTLDDPEMVEARKALDVILKGHEPFPALVVDRHWTLIAANASLPPLLAGIEPKLLEPPVNVMRLSLHPGGLAPRIVNLGAWRSHAVERLRRQHRATGDTKIETLLREISSFQYAGRGTDAKEPAHGPASDVAVPLKLRTDAGLLSFLSTTTIFGTAVEITLSELVLEAFYPADEATGDILRRLK